MRIGTAFRAGAKIKVLGLAALFVGLSALLWLGARSAWVRDRLAGDEAMAVRAAPVELQRRSVKLRMKGNLTAETFQVRSRLGGRVAEVRFRVGDFVPQGSVVAVVESNRMAQTIAELLAGLGAAREMVKAKQEHFDQARKALERSRDLLQKDLIARSDVDLAAAALETARADVELAEARAAQQEAMLAQARELEKFARVSAASGGIVIARHADPGATVAESAPILSLADTTALHMKGQIPEEFAGSIQAGATVQVFPNADEKKMLSGKIVGIEGGAGEGERSALIEIDVKGKDTALDPETPAEAVVAIERQAIWLPRAAVIAENARHYVYQVADGRAQRREISLGVSADGAVEIAAGLKPGDWVVIDRVNSLKPGARLRVENLHPPKEISKPK